MRACAGAWPCAQLQASKFSTYQPTYGVLQAYLQRVHKVEGEGAADGEGEHAGDNEEHFADEAATNRLVPKLCRPPSFLNSAALQKILSHFSGVFRLLGSLHAATRQGNLKRCGRLIALCLTWVTE